MCVAGRLFDLMFAVEAFIKLAYEFGLCEGTLSGGMNSVQEVCMVVSGVFCLWVVSCVLWWLV